MVLGCFGRLCQRFEQQNVQQFRKCATNELRRDLPVFPQRY